MAASAELIQSKLEFDYDTRRYYDTVTWLAEVLPGSMRTPFEYSFDGQELYASDGSAMGEIFEDAIKQSKTLPAYERRRRLIEKDEYQDMLSMMHGDLPNTMVVVSDFPSELMNAKEDIGGYNVTRKQTMLRVITKNIDGTLSMYSQSLDGSNRRALEDIYYELGFEPASGELLGQRMNLELDESEQKILTDRLMGVYDRSLSSQFGGDWYAGIKGIRRQNTYEFVCEQKDLINAYLASTNRFTGGEAELNLAAALRARYINGKSYVKSAVNIARQVYGGVPIAAYALAMAEMQREGAIARREGYMPSGCGATIKLNSNLNEMGLSVASGTISELSAQEQLDMAGYGNQSEKPAQKSDKFGPLRFKCPKGHWNERKPAKSPKDFLTHCRKCNTSLKC